MKKNILFALYCSFCLLAFSCNDSNSEAMVPSGTGTGGSMARFSVVGDYLYVVDSRTLHVYDVNNPLEPVKLSDIELGFGIETIFPYQSKLFIGSMNGMHIYDIADPRSPVYLSTYSHITSCDPVVVQDNLAYVTLRTGNSCPRGWNQLDIIDITDPTAPELVTSYQMENPFGLGIDGNTLFVCEGRFGLKVLNVADPHDIQEVVHIKNLHAFDVIPSNKNLILTGEDGVFQYDYTQPENLKMTSRLTAQSCDN